MIEDFEEETITVTVKGRNLYGRRYFGQLNYFKILNPELVICHMEPSVTLPWNST